jgi:hypothetical protein
MEELMTSPQPGNVTTSDGGVDDSNLRKQYRESHKARSELKRSMGSARR